MTPELGLLLACATIFPRREDEDAIRQMLAEGIDWTLFARKAIDHDLACLAGHTLARVAPEMVPDDVLDALHIIVDQTRRRNRALFDELAGATAALDKEGIEAIPFKGPFLAVQAYGDLGLRAVRTLDFLIHDSDMAATMTVLSGLGYARRGALTALQIETIQRVQRKDIVYRKAAEVGIQPHIGLTPITMALDMDYAGLWRRTQRAAFDGWSMLSLAPEDGLILLAIHGGKEFWWNIKWTCDVAAFIAAHPALDWTAIAGRARAQGCLRMVLVAISLAHRYFHATVPDAIAAAERADPVIESMIGRIAAHWRADEPAAPPSSRTLWMNWLWLHDGVARRARYAGRNLLFPRAHHTASTPSPGDETALPSRVYRGALARAGRMRDALANSGLVPARMPVSAEMALNIKRHKEAREDANRVLAADTGNSAAWRGLGHALFGLKSHHEAIAAYDKALALEPDNMVTWRQRAAAMEAMGSGMDLPDSPLDPQNANAWAIHAGCLYSLKRFAEAAEASDRALSLDPWHAAAARMGIHARLRSCDWRKRDDDKRWITEGSRIGQHMIVPYYHRAICDSEEENFAFSQIWSKGYPRSVEPLWCGERYRHDKIRIAYMSVESHDPTTSLIVGVFEHHDKTRFETTAIALGPDDGSQLRRRIKASFDRFVDVQAMTDDEAARVMRELEIDIVIDLKGNAGDRRTGILARRIAPAQVNYLGYTGTMGVSFIDYIIADHIVIPAERQINYSEKVVYMPHTYVANDDKRRIAEKTPSRIEAELPETGFVFACFNDNYKFDPNTFDVWMRLLRQVEGSVLWLRFTDTESKRNLWREAKSHGVAPERLVFAPYVPRAENHLARLRLADLFLDTLPFNAHATACDALWAGLPVLTCMGNTFAGRVAASLLHAIGLPELVTSSLAEYEDLALALARDPKRLAAIRATLARNRDTAPLFDTRRFTRDLEGAYTMMWERTQRGETPESFSVADAARV